MDLVISPHLRIPFAELELTYARSSGPGGQNVNKVNSKAVLRWNLVASPSVRPDLRERLLAKLGARLTLAGELLIACDEYRDQPRNREACFEKLRALLVDGLRVPKTRRDTKPTRGSQRRRVEGKRLQSAKKRQRSGRGDD